MRRAKVANLWSINVSFSPGNQYFCKLIRLCIEKGHKAMVINKMNHYFVV